MSYQTKSLTVGILSAMPEEIGYLLENLDELKKVKYGSLDLYCGLWKGNNSNHIEINIISAWSGWGKVNSAYAATRIICEAEKQKCKLDLIIFSGVAGASNPSLKQWDVVIANSYVQHDMDATPLFEKFIIPNLEISEIKTNKNLQQWAKFSLEKSCKNGLLKNFGDFHSGLIATGDKFISSKEEMKLLRNFFPELLAVEMEGASVAQVSYLESIPFLAIRVISDQADDNAAQSFNNFIKSYKKESWNIIKSLLSKLEIDIQLK